jgi:hypothetical protein
MQAVLLVMNVKSLSCGCTRKTTAAGELKMKLNKMLVMAGIAVAMYSANSLVAQEQPRREGGQGQPRGEGERGGDRGRGGFDPARMQEMMMNRTREQLGIKDDAEWKAIEPLITKVNEARRDAMASTFRGFMGGGRGPGGGGSSSGGENGGDRGRSRGGFGGERSAEEEALAKAIEAKAPKAELKTKMAAVRKVKEGQEAKLKEAQDNLKKVLTVEQEAAALQMGLVR